MQHILSIDDLTINFIMGIVDRAMVLKSMRRNPRSWADLRYTLFNSLMVTSFFEPSTRTRLSFEAAMTYLGGHVIGTENAAEFSSSKKGESIADNFRVISRYCDVIVGRFLNEGDARIAAAACSVPLINGGDGVGEHPTQALIDLFSIIEKFPDRTDLTISFLGDNKHSRTVRSLARLLARFPSSYASAPASVGTSLARITGMNFISSPEYMPDQEFLEDLRRHRIIILTDRRIDIETVVRGYLQSSDVVYVTRSQTERHQGLSQTISETGAIPIEDELKPFVLKKEWVQNMPSRAIVLHPLPRNSELPVEIDDDPRACYFEQAGNGLYVRMALLEAIYRR